MAKTTPAISSRMPAVNSRRADNCSILGIPFCAKIVLHPVDVPGTNCNVPQGLSHCSGRHWCIQRHQKQCRPHLVGNIVFRHTTAFFLLPSCGRCFYFLFFCATWTIMATKIIAATIPIKGSHVSVMLCNTAFQFTFSGNIV